MTVKAEFRELSVSQVSTIRQVIESSSVFNSVAESNSQSIAASAGFLDFSASLVSEWSNAIETTSHVEGTSETYDEEQVQYESGFLQIFRDVTKTVRIGTNTATVKEIVHKDSVPADMHESDEQLLERAGKYIEAEYGHKQMTRKGNTTAQIVGRYKNHFEMETCVDQN